MPGTRTPRPSESRRAAFYARVSDRSQAEEDKTSLAEQIGDMEAYCAERGYTITARYQEVGRGWSKQRPEFQRMLADARDVRFDTIVCWKSDRLSCGMYPAAALMEVVEARRIGIEVVMDGRHQHERPGEAVVVVASRGIFDEPHGLARPSGPAHHH